MLFVYPSVLWVATDLITVFAFHKYDVAVSLVDIAPTTTVIPLILWVVIFGAFHWVSREVTLVIPHKPSWF
jgi:hypothetical protein